MRNTVRSPSAKSQDSYEHDAREFRAGSDSREEADLTAGVPEENSLIFGEASLAQIRHEGAECLRRVRMIDEQRFCPRGNFLRFARLGSRFSVAFADSSVIDFDL